MRIRPFSIVHLGNPILRRKSRPVPSYLLRQRNFKQLIERMYQTMRRAKGVGIAAPQVGKSLRLAVIECLYPGRPHVSKKIVVNPKILTASRNKEYVWEGCLSIPGLRGLVPRHSVAEVEYLDCKQGRKKFRRVKGWEARIFQHEVDHLNGLVYLDRITNIRHLMTTQEYRKRILAKKK